MLSQFRLRNEEESIKAREREKKLQRQKKRMDIQKINILQRIAKNDNAIFAKR
jgi:fructose-1,6-bisphosphatase/sedoheptulose 1,7-bisphosphatase-like protein